MRFNDTHIFTGYFICEDRENRGAGQGLSPCTYAIGAVEIQWGQPYIPAVPGREERRPPDTPLPVSMAPAVSCREGAKRPADDNMSPNDIVSKRQGSLCENRANGHGTGTGRKCANLARPRECRMKDSTQGDLTGPHWRPPLCGVPASPMNVHGAVPCGF